MVHTHLRGNTRLGLAEPGKDPDAPPIDGDSPARRLEGRRALRAVHRLVPDARLRAANAQKHDVKQALRQ